MSARTMLDQYPAEITLDREQLAGAIERTGGEEPSSPQQAAPQG